MTAPIEDGLILNVDPSNCEAALRAPDEVLLLKCFAIDHIQANCIMFLTNRRLEVFRLQNFFQYFSIQLPRLCIHMLFGWLVALVAEGVGAMIESPREAITRRARHSWIARWDLAACQAKKMRTLSVPLDSTISRFKNLEIRNKRGSAMLIWQWRGPLWPIKDVPKSNRVLAFSPRCYEVLKTIAGRALSMVPADEVDIEVSDAKIVVAPRPASGQAEPGKTRGRSWDFGGALIFVSSCLCLGSAFMPWLGDLTGESRRLTDMPIGLPLFLLILYGGPLAYPVITLLTGRVLRKGWGIVCAAFGLVLGVLLGVGMLGQLPELYRLLGGYYVYLLSMLGLAVGVLLHRPAHVSSQNEEREYTGAVSKPEERGSLTPDLSGGTPKDAATQKVPTAAISAAGTAVPTAQASRRSRALRALGGLLILVFLGYLVIAAVRNILFTPLHIHDPWRLSVDLVILGLWVYGLWYLLRLLFGRGN